MKHSVANLLPAQPVGDRAKPLPTSSDQVVMAVSARLAAALRATGISYAQAGKAAGVSKSRVCRWCAPHEQTVYNARHEELWRLKLPRLYDELTRRRRPAGNPAADLTRAMLQATKEQGELAVAMLEALADGHVDADEAKRIAREATDVIRVAESIRARAEEAGR